MRVRSLTWRPFRIPFRAPFATAGGALSAREGWLVRLETDGGLVGLGEASPLAGRALPAGRPAPAILADAAASLAGQPLPAVEAFVRSLAAAGAGEAAVRCALDTAACDVLAKAAGLRVAEVLSDAVRRRVPVNATIPAPAVGDAAAGAKVARAAGFPCVKLKVGMDGDADRERARVAAVRDALGPGVALRLDANGAWSVPQAVQIIRALEPLDIDLVEQPVPPGNLEGMRAVREAVTVTIAADEDVTGPEAARRVLESGAAGVLVVKPMVVGGLRAGREIAAAALAAGASAVVTTTLDAGVGIAAALHLAAALPEGSPPCGLATGALLQADLLARSPAVRDGALALPEGPGLGVELDGEQLVEFAGAPWEGIRC